MWKTAQRKKLENGRNILVPEVPEGEYAYQKQCGLVQVKGSNYPMSVFVEHSLLLNSVLGKCDC